MGLRQKKRISDESYTLSNDLIGLNVLSSKVLACVLGLDTQLTSSLQGKGRVLEPRASSSNQIGLALCHNLIGLLAVGDRAHSNDAQALDLLLDTLGKVNLVTGRVGNLLIGSVACRRDVHNIDASVASPLGDLDSLVDGPGGDIQVLNTVGSGQAQEHRLLSREVGADGLDDLEQQTGAVLERAAVMVGALVGDRGQELVDQVAVGAVDLDSVHTGLVGADGALGERLHDLRDLVDQQLARDLVLVVPAQAGGRAHNFVGPVLGGGEGLGVIGGLGGSLPRIAKGSMKHFR